jgi:hypothetical protein
MLAKTVVVLAAGGLIGVWWVRRSQAVRHLSDRMMLSFLERYSHFEEGSMDRSYRV